MVEDVVRSLGYATLGSRLKRIGEKLQAQTQELTLELADTDLPTPHNPVLAALDLNGPLSIGDLARALGQSQPGVTRMVNRMKSDGLVEALQDDKDRRVSTIALTSEGRALVDRLQKTLWPAVSLAVENTCSGLEGSFLDQLSLLEAALSEKTLKDRVPGTSHRDWHELIGRREEAK